MDLCFISVTSLDSYGDMGYSLLSKFMHDNTGDHLFVVTEGDCGGLDAVDLEWYRIWARSEKNYSQVAMEWLDDWNRRTKFSNNLMYGNFSIWWLERFAFHDWLFRFLMDLDAVDRIVSETKPSHIFGIWLDHYWLDILRIISDKYGIGVSTVDKHFDKKTSKKRIRLVRALRCVQGSYRLLRHRIVSGFYSKPRVFIRTSSLVWQKVCGGKDSESLDTQYGYSIEKMSKVSDVIAMDYMTFADDGIRAVWRKRYPYIPIEGYWYYIWKASRKANSLEQGFLEDIEKNFGSFFIGMCDYRGFDISETFGMRLWGHILSRAGEIIRNIELYSMIFKKERPDVVVTTAEYGYGGYMIVAARLLGIPTVGLQHAIIYESHTGYMYPKDSDVREIPICDTTIVYGEAYKRLLVDNSVYSEDSIVVSGNPRFDILSLSNSKFYSHVISKNISNIESNIKVVLFSSQPIAHKLAPDIIMSGMKELQNGGFVNKYFLVIKLHPAEEFPCRCYDEAAARYGISDYIVTKDTDLYELMYLCDVHVSVNSSSISEAVAFHKPSLVLDCIDPSDLGSWNKLGVAFSLGSFPNFGRAVNVLCFDHEYARRFLGNSDKFIDDHFYSLDGRSSERVCKEISDIADNSRLKHGEDISL